MNQASSQACAICSRQPEDMLILACAHNLCLDCATELFSASPQRNTLQCEICFSETPLDQQTVHCLGSLNSTNRPQTIRQADNTAVKPPKDEKGLICQQHRQKSIYFCFDCQSASICSECILGTAHSGHKVSTVKKAIKIVADKLTEHMKELQAMKKAIKEQTVSILQIKQKLIVTYQQRQGKLKALFDDILKQVNTRFNELSIDLEKNSRRSLEILQGSLCSLKQKCEQIERAMRDNKEVLKKQNSEQIMVRFTQIQLQKQSYRPELPINYPESQNSLVMVGQSCLSVMDSILRKICWQDSSYSFNQKQNREDLSISHDEGSELVHQKVTFQGEMDDSELGGKLNNSVNKYSGIKATSRRLQLNRSMNNATNIINKLQERMKR